LPEGVYLWQALNTLVSLGLVTLLFALIFKLLPDVHMAWGDVWVGAAVTAVVVTIRKDLIGLYLGRTSAVSAFGRARSLVVILIWVYYSAQILLFGAEFTRVYASRRGAGIEPKDHAMLVTPEARIRPGMPPRTVVDATGQPAKAGRNRSLGGE